MLHLSVIPAVLAGVVLVVMVTAAPLAGEDNIGSADQSNPTVDHVKRAEEEIYFGNQQNEARGVAKKSDDAAGDMETPDDKLDAGTVVVSHEETPVEQDLAQRAELAKGEPLGQATNEAFEFAMHQAVQNVLDGANEENVDVQKESNDVEEEKSAEEDKEADGNPEAADEKEDETTGEAEEETVDEEDTLPSTGTSETNNAKDEGEETTDDTRTDDETKTDTMTDDVSVNGPAPVSVDPVLKADQFQDEERILQEIPYRMDYREESLLPQSRNEQFSVPGFLSQLKNQYQAPSFDPWSHRPAPYFDYYASPSSHDRRRRIKRDLLDDEFGIPYSQYQYGTEPRYSPESSAAEDNEDPWTDDDIDYVYKLFLTYLEEKAEDELEKERERQILRELPYWAGSDDTADDSTGVLPDDSADEMVDDRLLDGEDFIVPYLSEDDESPADYEPRYRFSPQDVEDSDVDDSGVSDSYDSQINKRFFTALTGGPEEPEQPQVGWGDFVPEKRDYSQAVQRLQRLALALNDNQGGYYKDMVEDYKRR